MKNALLALSVLTIGLLSAAPLATADHKRHHDHDRIHSSHANSNHIDYGRVINATPIYQTVSRRIPQEQCWVETVHTERGHKSATAPIVGGLIGGAIGNRLGHSNTNKKVGAVAGAILGASIAHDISSKRRPYNVSERRDIERCETVYTTERHQEVVGYDVSYRYQGQVYRTQTNTHPGKRIKLDVTVRPLG